MNDDDKTVRTADDIDDNKMNYESTHSKLDSAFFFFYTGVNIPENYTINFSSPSSLNLPKDRIQVLGLIIILLLD